MRRGLRLVSSAFGKDLRRQVFRPHPYPLLGGEGVGLPTQKAAPRRDHRAKAIHSERVKLPGTDGTTFIAPIAAATAAPNAASAASPRKRGPPGRRARARSSRSES